MNLPRLARGQMMDAATWARIGYHGFMTNRTIVIPGFANRVLVGALSLLPQECATRFVGILQA